MHEGKRDVEWMIMIPAQTQLKSWIVPQQSTPAQPCLSANVLWARLTVNCQPNRSFRRVTPSRGSPRSFPTPEKRFARCTTS